MRNFLSMDLNLKNVNFYVCFLKMSRPQPEKCGPLLNCDFLKKGEPHPEKC